jgi:hypothetical protein
MRESKYHAKDMHCIGYVILLQRKILWIAFAKTFWRFANMQKTIFVTTPFQKHVIEILNRL